MPEGYLQVIYGRQMTHTLMMQISLREMRAELAQQKDDLKQFQNQFSSKEGASHIDITAYLRAKLSANTR